MSWYKKKKNHVHKALATYRTSSATKWTSWLGGTCSGGSLSFRAADMVRCQVPAAIIPRPLSSARPGACLSRITSVLYSGTGKVLLSFWPWLDEASSRTETESRRERVGRRKRAKNWNVESTSPTLPFPSPEKKKHSKQTETNEKTDETILRCFPKRRNRVPRKKAKVLTELIRCSQTFPRTLFSSNTCFV